MTDDAHCLLRLSSVVGSPGQKTVLMAAGGARQEQNAHDMGGTMGLYGKHGARTTEGRALGARSCCCIM